MLKFTQNGRDVYVNPACAMYVKKWDQEDREGTAIALDDNYPLVVDQPLDQVAELITKALSDNPIERRAAIRSTRATEPA